jgi:tetratricopeptide (TPR) repeat protein
VASLVCAPAYPDEPAPSAGPRDARQAIADTDPAANEREAMRLRGRGLELFNAQQYAEALALFERAHALSSDPRHLFNVAAAHHWLGHCERARTHFEQYLRVAPAGAGADEARAALGELYERCGREPVESAPSAALHEPAASPTLIRGLPIVVAPPPAEQPSSSADHALAWSLIATGVALGVASATSYILMERTEDELELRVRRAADDGWPPEARALMKNGDRYATLTAAFGVSAVACVGAGITLRLLAPSRAESLSLSFGDTATVRYRARF